MSRRCATTGQLWLLAGIAAIVVVATVADPNAFDVSGAAIILPPSKLKQIASQVFLKVSETAKTWRSDSVSSSSTLYSLELSNANIRVPIIAESTTIRRLSSDSVLTNTLSNLDGSIDYKLSFGFGFLPIIASGKLSFRTGGKMEFGFQTNITETGLNVQTKLTIESVAVTTAGNWNLLYNIYRSAIEAAVKANIEDNIRAILQLTGRTMETLYREVGFVTKKYDNGITIDYTIVRPYEVVLQSPSNDVFLAFNLNGLAYNTITNLRKPIRQTEKRPFEYLELADNDDLTVIVHQQLLNSYADALVQTDKLTALPIKPSAPQFEIVPAGCLVTWKTEYLDTTTNATLGDFYLDNFYLKTTSVQYVQSRVVSVANKVADKLLTYLMGTGVPIPSSRKLHLKQSTFKFNNKSMSFGFKADFAI